MTNLFIVGNGFDKAHGLATGYSDFHNYLLKMYPNAAKLSPSFSIDSTLMPDGEEVFDKNEVVAFIMDIISEAEGEENDLFLNFNYTSVLEEIYDVENICYIHRMQNSEIIFGHGEEKEDFENIYTGSEFDLAEIHFSLMKDTNKIIEESNYFFDELTSVKNIYSYGFSFSKVDLPYINEVCIKCNTKNCTWYLQGHEPERESESEFEQRKEYQKEIIKNCGFDGEFDVFNI